MKWYLSFYGVQAAVATLNQLGAHEPAKRKRPDQIRAFVHSAAITAYSLPVSALSDF
jgi:hypothetical protein